MVGERKGDRIGGRGGTTFYYSLKAFLRRRGRGQAVWALNDGLGGGSRLFVCYRREGGRVLFVCSSYGVVGNQPEYFGMKEFGEGIIAWGLFDHHHLSAPRSATALQDHYLLPVTDVILASATYRQHA